ncbi:MAG: hypothetical protein H8D56_01680 [Planctomycetes bacterium]|nr:hypothetical protein [Planctomycetota bacterium]MBL7143173.1 hypothetical protein [Phycisphaerae bacterium]
MKRELRFCIGEPTGLHSTTWKIWVNRNDVYLSSRMLASDIKVSLHESGKCQFSHTSESFAHRGKSNRDRHIQKWIRRRTYPENGVVHLFRVIIPSTELRSTSAEKKEAKGVIWYAAPPSGYGAYIELWLTPVLDRKPGQDEFMNDLLGVLSLANGQHVGVTVRYLKIKSKNIKDLVHLRDQAGKLQKRKDPRTRGWALFWSKQDIYALVEFAPFLEPQ